MNTSIIEHVKRGHWPLPRRENDERLREFRMKMAQRAVVVPNFVFSQSTEWTGARMNTKEILIAAREKIERAENWAQHDYARDADGEYIDPESTEATCWCGVGALAAVLGGVSRTDDSPALRALCDATNTWFTVFNDRSTHAEVLAAFDKAIAAQG